MRVLIIGHSYISRLEAYLSKIMGDFGLREVNIDDISFLAVRGGTVDRFMSRVNQEVVRRQAPDIVILHLGGNEVDGSAPPQLIGMHLYELAKLYRSLGVKHVTVCQIVRREKWRHLSFKEGTERVRMINEFLVAVCDGSNQITTWRHRGLWQPVNVIFGRDGVHFNSLGNYKFFKCLRGAILQACRTVVN